MTKGNHDETLAPRLTTMRGASRLMAVSYWTVRDYVLAGLLPTVELPPLRPREGERPRRSLRRVLIDVADIDAFIEARKCGSASVHQSPAPQIELRKPRRNRAGVPAVCPDASVNRSAR
ncbi:MAG: hypothetical protein HYX76_08455 [Acidobacteria bacterium]|nr:hypothetical protein [Acidobacteriota bacterium]